MMGKHFMIAAMVLSASLVMVPGLSLASEDGGVTAKQTPPVGSAPRDFSLPKIETYTLKNGTRVTLASYGSVPKVAIRAVTAVGNLNDGETPWIADLAARMIVEGAAGRSASEQALLAAAMGGDLNIGAGLDQTIVTMDVLSENAGDAIGLMGDVLQRPDFPTSEFERVKQNLLRNLSVAQTRPQSLATDAFIGAMYPDHPYAEAVLPDADDFSALTLEQVAAFHSDNFGAARTHIYVVGQFKRRAVKRAIKKSFGKWAAGPAPLSSPPGTGADPQLLLVDRPDAAQSTVRLGKRVPAISGALDLSAANTMLGGYFSSRITRNIREDKGFTYSPSSGFSREVGTAYWRQNADITSESTGPALTEIIKEIRGLQETPPPADELEGVKNYMNGVYVIGLASRGGLARQLGFVDLHELGLGYLENYVGVVNALSAQDLQNAAKEHLKIDEMSLVVVGDLAGVRPQLEAIPEFERLLTHEPD